MILAAGLDYLSGCIFMFPRDLPVEFGRQGADLQTQQLFDRAPNLLVYLEPLAGGFLDLPDSVSRLISYNLNSVLVSKPHCGSQIVGAKPSLAFKGRLALSLRVLINNTVPLLADGEQPDVHNSCIGLSYNV